MNKRSYKNMAGKAGASPGEVVYIGEEHDEPSQISVIDFKGTEYQDLTTTDVNECSQYQNTDANTWINFRGIHDVELLNRFGDEFQIHPLIREDISNTHQRPKLEEYDREIFLVLKLPHLIKETGKLSVQQVSFLLRENHLITFQHRSSPVFDNILSRIKSGGKRITQMGNDYLLYALLDALVDHYFVILEAFSEEVEEMEGQLLDEEDEEEEFSVYELYNLKREMIELRRAAWPMRDILSSLYRSDNQLLSEDTHFYFRDVYDHTIQVIDTFESLRDVMSSLLDLRFTTVSNQMNEVMKVLTIIGTIFIPLTFIAGIYGMNFAYMPELAWQWGYFAVWGVMIIVAIVMIVFFKRKDWL